MRPSSPSGGEAGIDGGQCDRDNLSKVILLGVGTGMLSGCFGIGGGFLIVPALIVVVAGYMLYRNWMFFQS